MTKQNMNGKDKATLEEMVQSGSQIVLLREDGSEQPIEAMVADQQPVEVDPYAGEYHYKNWWNQFRGPWLQSEKMSEDEIKTKADDAWECSDYKEMINLMAELICRLQQKQ
ncbi:MAG: hypothetical protein Q8M98_02780 [Candidatus Cloacimonadaceae bacterium]|nr:hypothetical protein [Candidatus Cloacimonadaceae bacterium]MDP3113678.1 hypothetical protein [Candidatus Cloacimonadaceae bacterium]